MPEIINEVRPFRALHYNNKKIKHIGLCLSQPYDVISQREQDEYYRQHEYNVIRLILNRIRPDDNESNNRYTRARDFISQWQRNNVIYSTQRPSFWIYEQTFNIPGMGSKKVKGFIGLVKLHEYDEMKVLPHEKVLKKPLKDRVKLTEVTNIQFEYIWSIYQDESYIIDKILDDCEKDPPIINYYEEKIDVHHKLWRLVDAEKCGIIRRTMQNQKIYIADGHHRYQTMLNIRNKMRRKHFMHSNAPWEYIMMFLVNSKHEGLAILPTHRLLYDLKLEVINKLIEESKKYFHVQHYPFDEQNEPKIRKRLLNDLKVTGTGEHKFAVYINGNNEYFILTLKDEEEYKKLDKKQGSTEWRLLDVNILNRLIFADILGITEKQMNLQTNLQYTKDADKALDSIRRGKMQLAVLLNPTRLKQVISIADNREMMPRKSTHFFPKPLSGLVFFSMDRKNHNSGL